MRLQSHLTITDKEERIIEESYKVASERFENWDNMNEDTQDELAHEVSLELKLLGDVKHGK